MFGKDPKPQKNTLSLDDIRNVILSLKLPPIMLDLFNETGINERLKCLSGTRYQAPYPLLEMPLHQAVKQYKVDRYIPFLAVWQDIIFAYDSEKKGFVRYGIESFDADNLQLLTWEDLLLEEVIAWWELEWQEEDIIYMSDLFCLKQIEEVLRELALCDEKGLSYGELKKKSSGQNCTEKSLIIC